MQITFSTIPGGAAARALLAAVCVGCATTPERDDQTLQAPAVKLPPPPPKPFAELATCAAHIDLVRAAPVVFEGDVVAGLVDVELRVEGPATLSVELGSAHRDLRYRVDLPPRVTLRLPAGPAEDKEARPTGAVFDLLGFATAGIANVLALPITVPTGMLTGHPEWFLVDPPTYAEGMFDDVVLDATAWTEEVERRSAPHKVALAEEAARQARFATWRSAQRLERQARTCVVGDTGQCTIAVMWPEPAMRVTFAGHSCATTPRAADSKNRRDPRLPGPVSTQAFLPRQPTPRTPEQLKPPKRLADDPRGAGARATRDAWRKTRDAQMSAAAVSALWPLGAHPRDPADLVDATLLCRIESRRSDWDPDLSPPELSVRLAFGFDGVVAGQTFPTVSARKVDIGLRHVTLRAGEMIKISVVDIDEVVDDWGGMVLARYEGRWPMTLRHAAFQAECRIAD